MLTREEAEKRLKAFHIKNWVATRTAELGKLPKTLCEVGRALLDRDASGKPFKNWQRGHTTREEAAEQLETLTERDRLRIFKVLFPKLSGAIEAGWQLLAKLPYTEGYSRKAFRAPTDPSVHRSVRLEFLTSLISQLGGYDPDVAWCAAWAPHLSGGYESDQLGFLLAAAIDAGGPQGEEVFQILRDSATNDHEVGCMGRHVTRALLVASRPDGWEFVEKLLLAAQRQEGLRQVILESIDEAHPQAFRRMVRLILEHNLLRFSATVRAVDVWFELQWDSVTPAVIKKSLELVLEYLENPNARDKALATESGEPLYFALWTIAFEDALAAIKPAAALLKDPKVERRFIALHFLRQIDLKPAQLAARDCLEDPDLRIAVTALEMYPDDAEDVDIWDRIIALRERMPAKREEAPALIWPWATTTLDRKEVTAQLVNRRGKRPATALIPFLNDLESYARGNLVELLGKMKKWDAATRDTLFQLVGDRDQWVRQRALAALKKCEVGEADAQRVEELLKRKGSELRQGVLKLLAKQKTPFALASADRLLSAKKAEQRLGGLELMRMLVEKKRAASECRQRAEAYRVEHPEPGEDEQLHIEAILDIKRVVPTRADALGLMDPTKRTPAPLPQVRKVTLCSAATMACLTSLDALVEKHKKTPITVETYEGQTEMLLGNVNSWQFPSPIRNRPADEDAVSRLPLYPVWKDWYDNRPKQLKDADGLELVRGSVWWALDNREWKNIQKRYGKSYAGFLKQMLNGETPVKLKHPSLVGELVQWLLRLHPPAGAPDFLLDALETGFANVPEAERTRVVDLEHWNKRDRDWRNASPIDPWQRKVDDYRGLVSDAWNENHYVRLWRLMHWRDQPAPGVGRMPPNLEYLVAGWKAGEVSEADVFDQLLAGEGQPFYSLRTLTGRNAAYLRECPTLAPLIERCKERILEVELTRGETPTAATGLAGAITSLAGASMLVRLLTVLGTKAPGRHTFGDGRVEVLTHLIQVTYPTTQDTPEAFAEQMKQAGVSRERLLELAFLAPQWVDHIEQTIDWPGLKEGVWWFLAHMLEEYETEGLMEEDNESEVDAKGKEVEQGSRWERIVRERTALTEEERNEGAVDTAWFHRIYPPLGRKRWEALGAAAKYGCSDNSYKKAIFLAEVLLGRAKKRDLIDNIRHRKLKDSVRYLGLLPLPEGDRREAELLARYKVLQEYRRYARSLGPMSREGAVRIATIGLDNLARTAGYPDPIRLEWAMEAREIADLAAGPVSVTQDGVTVTLAIDAQAQPELTVRRGDRPLKAIPPAVRKHPKVAALAERRMDLKRSASRVKQSLELAMCRGDAFTGMELRQLFLHPLLRPLLERLVLIGEGIRGYPTAQGQALEDYAGKLEPIRLDERLRIAHPHDLFTAGDWDKWQAHCFRTERVQPFKQVFRELYVLTQQERADDAISRRYAGQQVNPLQAKALWGSRGWSVRDEVTKTFHELGIEAEVSFRHHGWTALEVEGLTLDGVQFRRRDEYGAMPLDQVPPRVFSEVMRDCDLVVSVAHRGGVDPEASASTVEMRSALLRETCALLNIPNYQIVSNHVLIDGKLGNYSVHLGSAVVHRQPGGSLCIVPVHAQHRGRLFLPFADDDPRSAEVISKVLLLARDHEIQDPSILEQLR